MRSFDLFGDGVKGIMTRDGRLCCRIEISRKMRSVGFGFVAKSDRSATVIELVAELWQIGHSQKNLIISQDTLRVKFIALVIKPYVTRALQNSNHACLETFSRYIFCDNSPRSRVAVVVAV